MIQPTGRNTLGRLWSSCREGPHELLSYNGTVNLRWRASVLNHGIYMCSHVPHLHTGTTKTQNVRMHTHTVSGIALVLAAVWLGGKAAGPEAQFRHRSVGQ
jgi:hypothetical protein